MKKTLVLFVTMLWINLVYSQCDPTVPLYVIDLSNNKTLNHQFDVTSGICEMECGGLMSEFFQFKRKA